VLLCNKAPVCPALAVRLMRIFDCRAAADSLRGPAGASYVKNGGELHQKSHKTRRQTGSQKKKLKLYAGGANTLCKQLDKLLLGHLHLCNKRLEALLALLDLLVP